MIKTQQKILKKGDYYEIEAYEQTMLLVSKSKRQQIPIVSSTNIPASQYILTQIPTFNQARQNYFVQKNRLTQEYSTKGLLELKTELQLMINDQNLNDEDRKEVQRLIQQMDEFRDSKVVSLNKLPEEKEEKLQAKQATYNKINLTATYNISNLSKKIEQLQKLDFPQLHNIQHQLEIMLGQKKPLQTVELDSFDLKQKQELQSLYNHLNSLSIVNNIPSTVQKVFLNQQKHVQMQNWLQKNSNMSTFHTDFVKQLKKDEQLINKLQQNWKGNLKHVKQILQEVKGLKK